MEEYRRERETEMMSAPTKVLTWEEYRRSYDAMSMEDKCAMCGPAPNEIKDAKSELKATDTEGVFRWTYSFSMKTIVPPVTAKAKAKAEAKAKAIAIADAKAKAKAEAEAKAKAQGGV